MCPRLNDSFDARTGRDGIWFDARSRSSRVTQRLPDQPALPQIVNRIIASRFVPDNGRQLTLQLRHHPPRSADSNLKQLTTFGEILKSETRRIGGDEKITVGGVKGRQVSHLNIRHPQKCFEDPWPSHSRSRRLRRTLGERAAQFRTDVDRHHEIATPLAQRSHWHASQDSRSRRGNGGQRTFHQYNDSTGRTTSFQSGDVGIFQS